MTTIIEADRTTIGSRWIGEPLPRKEDERLLRGDARFVDDMDFPGVLHMAVGRSPYPHALLGSVDTAGALAIPGVVAVLTGADVVRRSRPLGVLRPLPDMPELAFHAMAVGRVRFEGQPVVSVVATSRALAEDALEAVNIDYDPLPHVTDTVAALDVSAPVVWDHLGTNLAATHVRESGDPDARFRVAARIVKGRFRIGRITGLPMETRGVIADWSPGFRTLTVVSSTQVPHLLRMQLAECLDLPESVIRVIAPDVGGGFGVKLGIYPEDVLACLHSADLRRPVKWIEDRLEHFQSSTHAREAIHDAEISVTSEGELTALRDTYVIDMGAYNSPFGPPMLTSLMLPGPYRLVDARIERRIAITNKPPIGAYRGYGQPESNFVREVLIDRASHALGLDPVNVRRRNLLRSDELPFENVSGAIYDSGDYPAALERVVEAIDYDSADRTPRTPGRRVGLGVSVFLEMTGYAGSRALGRSGARFGAYESVTLRANRDGGVELFTGVPAFGQGHETAFAQICASVLGISPDSVIVRSGDTLGTPYNVGGFASRTMIAGSGAILGAANQLLAKTLRIAGHLLDVEPSDLEVVDGVVRRRGEDEDGVTFAEIVRHAYSAHRLPAGESPGLESTAYFDPPASAFGSGAAATRVEVDPLTGEYEVVRFVLSHDCGRQINPLVVEGQIRGGLVQGYSASVFEELSYDLESGGLSNGTMANYLVPTAADVPPFELLHSDVPSPVTPFGVRGVGEAGTIPVASALANAICDALFPLQIELDRIPLTAERVWHAIEEAKTRDIWPDRRS